MWHGTVSIIFVLLSAWLYPCRLPSRLLSSYWARRYTIQLYAAATCPFWTCCCSKYLNRIFLLSNLTQPRSCLVYWYNLATLLIWWWQRKNVFDALTLKNCVAMWNEIDVPNTHTHMTRECDEWRHSWMLGERRINISFVRTATGETGDWMVLRQSDLLACVERRTTQYRPYTDYRLRGLQTVSVVPWAAYKIMN